MKTPISTSSNTNLLQQGMTLRQVIEDYWRDVLDIPAEIAIDKSSFKELSGSFHLAEIFVGKINKYLKKSEKLSEFANPLDLSQDFMAYYQSLSLQYSKAKLQKEFGDQIVNLPKMEVFSTYLQKVETKDFISVVEYNEEALKILVDYYNQRYGIAIHYGASFQAILDIIANAEQEFKDYTQIGLLLLATDTPNTHSYPAVLCKDKESGRKILLVNEPMSNVVVMDSLTGEEGLLRKIQIQFPEIEIRFDSNLRQIDSHSCSTIALLYLKEALRVDMLQDSILILDKEDINYELLLDAGIAEHFRDCLAFISPAETYKYSQGTIPKEINQNVILKTGIKKQTLAAYRAASTIEVFMSLTHEKNEVNLVSWDKSFAFKAFIEAKVAKEILPQLYHFIIKFNQEDHDIYLKKSFCTATLTLDALKNLLKLYFDVLDMRLNLVTSHAILTSTEQLHEYLEAAGPALFIRMIDQNTLEQEEADSKILQQSFIELYNKSLNPVETSAFFIKAQTNQPSFQPTTLKNIFLEALKQNGLVLSTIMQLGWVDEDCDLLNDNLFLSLAREEAIKELDAIPQSTPISIK